MRRDAARWPWLLGALTLLAGALPLQAGSLAHRPDRALPAVLYLQSPAVARRVSLSFDSLMADLYWIRALQHFGASRLQQGAPSGFADLYPFLDLATSLDQRFTVAYRFGAIFLSEPPPGGPGRPDLAVRLLEKGIASQPDRWQYWQDLGFVHYWWTGRYDKAAEAFSKGADTVGAPWWMKSLAAVTLAEGGDRQTSRLLWKALAQTNDNDWLRKDAQRRLLQLDAMDQMDALTTMVGSARQRGMQAPWSWAALFARGWLRQLPVDPTGTPYELDLTSGVVRLGRGSSLAPLPVEPRSRAGVAVSR
ncbi:MAG TPA: hypothetical protein VMF13_01380 [Luteitalea sp.]|nr:hypothetical protein [Luteitalea sp.]